ncbi:hypothetical protein AX16_009901 [Volvariella volvacea WC 439]|nr:hypothetical protein AX16_009901 [Volvariella volvacea WC 439]
MDPSYAPPGESAYDLYVERSNLNGVILSGVAYGVLLTITIQALLLFLKPPKGCCISWPLVIYLGVVAVLATIGFGGNAKFNQMTYIDYRNYPGGPNVFTVDFYQHWTNMMSFASYTVLSWIADGLVLWRFSLIYNNYLLCALPGLMYSGAIASSISLLVAMTRPTASFWSERAVRFGIAYWSLSISLNIILTLAISGRLLYVQNRIKRALGVEHSQMYTSIASMLVESAALYTIWGLVFLICYARNTPFQNIVLPPLGQVQGIAPVLILLRVAQGRAWTKETTFTSMTTQWRVKQPTHISSTTGSMPLSELTAYNPEAGKEIQIAMTRTTETTSGVLNWEVGKDDGIRSLREADHDAE